MVVGYNHNIRYKGDIFHIQTEDSGINNPHIITLLYRGGNILASKKTSYADIVKMGNLNQIVEELMKEQHKEMLRRLKNGEFDARLGLEGVKEESSPEHAAEPAPEPVVQDAQQAVSHPAVAEAKPAPTSPPVEEPARKKQSLDDLIFDFLSAGDEKK